MLALRIAGIVLVLDALVVTLAGLTLSDSRAQHYLRAEIVSRNIASILADTVAGQFDRIDFALRVVAEAAEHEARAGHHGSLDETLRAAQDRVPEAANFRITDAQGRTSNATDAPALKAEVNLADRDYFQSLRNDPGAGLVMSPPLLGRFSNRWVIVLARRINDLHGGFAGIVYAPLPVQQVTDLFGNVDLGQGDAIALRGPLPSLGVIARYPELVGGVPAVGNSAVSQELQAMTTRYPERGNYIARAGIDGIERVLAYRKVGAYPYYVVVGQSTERMMTEWRRQSTEVAVLTAVFLCLTAAGALFAHRSLRARLMLEWDLRQALATSQELGAVLARRNDELARFADILAHHLQEPVRQQHIFAQHLARQLPHLPPDAAQSLESIQAAARKHLSLLHDAQSYLALDETGVRTVPVPADHALDVALERLAPQIAAAEAEIERSPLPYLPVASPALADLFAAVVRNAVTYCAPGVPPRVRIAAEQRGTETVVTITDNGIGIPVQYRDRLFRVFERLGSDGDRTGTGIGLALAKKIVEAAGGRIWIEQPEAGGTRICFSVPVAGSSDY